MNNYRGILSLLMLSILSVTSYGANSVITKSWSIRVGEPVSNSRFMFSESDDRVGIVTIGDLTSLVIANKWTGEILEFKSSKKEDGNIVNSKNLDVILTGTTLWRGTQAIDLKGIDSTIREVAVSSDGKYIAALTKTGLLVIETMSLKVILEKQTDSWGKSFSQLTWSNELGGFIGLNPYRNIDDNIRNVGSVFIWKPGLAGVNVVYQGHNIDKEKNRAFEISKIGPQGKYLLRWSENHSLDYPDSHVGNLVPFGSVEVVNLSTGEVQIIEDFSYSKRNSIALKEDATRLIVTNENASDAKVWDSKTAQLRKVPYLIDVLNASSGLFAKRYYWGNSDLYLGKIDQLDGPLSKIKVCPYGDIGSVDANQNGTMLSVVCRFVDHWMPNIHTYEVKQPELAIVY